MKRLLSVLSALCVLSWGHAQVVFEPPIAVGATASSNGVAGLIPAPAAGDNSKFIRGDFTYQSLTGGGDLAAANLLNEFDTLAEKANVASNLWVVSNSEGLARQWSALGHFKLDGATALQCGLAWIPGLNIGSGEMTMAARIRVPTNNPTSTCSIIGVSSSVSAQAAANACYWQIDTSGVLALIKRSAANSIQTVWSLSGFITSYGGREVMLITTRNASGWITYLDKSVLVANDTDYATESIEGQYFYVGAKLSGPYTDHISSAELFNFALSSAEVTELVDFGVLSKNRNWPTLAHFSNNQVGNAERNSTFTAGATDWTASGSGTSIGTDGVAVWANASDYVGLANTYITQLKAGQLHRFSIDVSSGTWGGNSVSVYWGVTAGDASLTALGTMTADGSYWFEWTPTLGVGFITLKCTGAVTATLDNITITPCLLVNGSFETLSGGAAPDRFGTWVETVDGTGTSTVNIDTSVVYSGATSCRFDIDAAGKYAAFETPSATLKPGQRYTLRLKVRHNKGSALGHFQYNPGAGSDVQVTSDDLGALSIADLTWTPIQITFTALGSRFGITRPSSGGLASKSLWFDSIELIPLTCTVSFTPWGLDNRTPRWVNQAGSGDATLYALTLDTASGTYPNIVIGPGKIATLDEHTRLSREGRALVGGGGVYLAGGAGQAITVSPLTAQDADVTNLWWRVRATIPTSNPSSSQGGLMLVSSSSTTTAAACVNMGIDTSGNLEIRVYGSSTSNYRQAEIPNIVSNFGGRTVTITVCRAGIGALYVWLNGQPAPYLETVSGTPPTWAADLTTTYWHFGLRSSSERWVGELFTAQYGRGLLTNPWWIPSAALEFPPPPAPPSVRVDRSPPRQMAW